MDASRFDRLGREWFATVCWPRVAVAGLALLGGCDTTAPRATVRFVIDAPLCSSVIPVQLFVDTAQVATDTFRVALTPEHLRSRDFPVAPGPHLVGARVVNGLVWPDTLVTLEAGESFTDSLPYYCS